MRSGRERERERAEFQLARKNSNLDLVLPIQETTVLFNPISGTLVKKLLDFVLFLFSPSPFPFVRFENEII